MAKKGTLVAGLASALGVPAGQVSLFYRFLSEARLITSTGARGVNAPDLSELDCSRIMIAMLATERPSAAPQAVVDFGKLPMTGVLRFNDNKTPIVEDGDSAIVAEDYLAAHLRNLAEMSASEAEQHSLLTEITCEPRRMQLAVFNAGTTTYFDDGGFSAEERAARRERHLQRLVVTRAVVGTTVSDIAAIFRRAGHA